MKRRLLIISFLAALLFGIFAPAVTSVSAAPRQQAHAQLFDKTRFVVHMGLAYFAFHHFVYARWRSGGFKAGASHRTLNIVKAGAALLFTYHELKVSYDIANKSNSGLLHALVKPLHGLVNQANAVATRLKGGQYSDAEVQNLTTSANAFSQQATKDGISIKDIKVFVPGQ